MFIIGWIGISVKSFSVNSRKINREVFMSENKSSKKNGAVKKGVAYWQEKWVTKVLANGHNPQAKLLFMRIASFGERGCWMNNETFQEEFNRSQNTISRAITSLWEKGDIIVTGWNGHGRRIYAAGHPKVRSTLNAQYNQSMRAGKVGSVEQYQAKMRLRK
jgi:hypothetical protein